MSKIDLKKCVQDAGGYQKLGEELGVTKQLVWSWVNVAKQIPATWVTQFSDITGIPRYKIRPDVFPKSREIL
jgi:DNA-binding transcriptional regulator YdaS (Cro superfamily)